MSKSHNLFDLIKAMDKGERRYFKLFASAFEGKDKNYIALFDAIVKQDKYDEKALKKKFAKASFIKHFAVVKNQLFHNIMRSMRLYYDNGSELEKIYSLHHNHHILQTKGLNTMAVEQLEKALKIANEGEMLTELVLLNYERNQRLVNMQFEGLSYEQVVDKLDEALRSSKNLVAFHDCIRVSMEVDYLAFQHANRAKNIQDRVLEISQLNILKDEAMPHLIRARIYYHQCRTAIAFMLKNYQKFYNESSAMEKLFDEKLFKKENEGMGYIIVLNNFLFGAIRVKPFEEVEQIANLYTQKVLEFKQKKISTTQFEARIFKGTCQYKMDYYLFHHQIDKLPTIVEEFDLQLNKIKNKICVFFRLKFEYQLAYAYWLIEDVEKAECLVDEMLNSANIKSHKEYYSANLILNLLLLYRKEEYEHLSYQIRNCQEALIRCNYLHAYEKELLKMLGQLLKNKNKVEVLKKYKVKFEKMKTDISQIDAFEKINILLWIDRELDLNF